MLITRGNLILLLAILSATPSVAVPSDSDLDGLLDGVSKISSPGIPGNISVFGPDAFAVVQDKQRNGAGSAVVAAAQFGEGRVVLFGHTGYFGVDSLKVADTGRLMLNAIRWSAADRGAPRIGVVGISTLRTYLTDRGLDALDIQLEDVSTVDVVLSNVDRIPDDKLEVLADFIRGGGGFLSTVTGWGWLQLNPGKDIRTDLSANRLFSQSGLVFADGFTRDTAQDGFDTSQRPSELTNASTALDLLVQDMRTEIERSEPEQTQIGASLTLAVHSMPPDDAILLPRLKQVMSEWDVDPIPTSGDPVTSKDVLARLVLTQQIHALADTPPEEVSAHPSAEIFPGRAPEGTPTVTRMVSVNTRIPGWHSTGLYADPGALITVELPASAAGQGLKVRIGSTTCRNWHHDKWSRAPEIAQEIDLEELNTKAASAFGGLVYIVVPNDCPLETVDVTIQGGVEAPYYVLGETSVEEWQSTIRDLPAPWAELASSKAVLTVPSAEIRTLDDPQSLMETWNRILDLCAELAAWESPARKRPERYVADVQLCAGYMHAGYPIMVPTSTASKLVDRQHLIGEGDWGFFHETGHNHQVGDWTFGGTGEVTVNLFTMYVFDKLCGISPEAGRMSEEGVQKRYREHFANGADFTEWKRRPFLALYMYYQLQQAFGWEAFTQVFAEYRDLSQQEHPRGDDAKRDQWLVRLSKSVGKNLGPFFEAWGVPTSAEAREAVQDLPIWMPEDFPPGTAEVQKG